jgi:cell division protein ZapA (FtsZ GTPase activity inhibitor)
VSARSGQGSGPDGGAPKEIETIELWVQGQRFEVRSDVDRDTARDVARYVNDKISEAASHCGPGGPRLNVVVLAALNIAKEHLELVREHQRLQEAVEEQSRRLLGSIESVL